jgi:hypothetical protein
MLAPARFLPQLRNLILLTSFGRVLVTRTRTTTTTIYPSIYNQFLRITGIEEEEEEEEEGFYNLRGHEFDNFACLKINNYLPYFPCFIQNMLRYHTEVGSNYSEIITVSLNGTPSLSLSNATRKSNLSGTVRRKETIQET